MDGSSPSPRDRRLWTQDEDDVLRREAEIQARHGGSVSDWRIIASKLPNRTNKDCRKRWSKISGGVSKGPWSAAEDDRLRTAVALRGSKWTEIARDVETRSADQCSKRWLHFLDPRLNRGKWAPMDDAQLINAVSELGTDWKRICELHFPSRSATNVKNRYNNIRQRPIREVFTEGEASSSAAAAVDAHQRSSRLSSPNEFRGSPMYERRSQWSHESAASGGMLSDTESSSSVHLEQTQMLRSQHLMNWTPEPEALAPGSGYFNVEAQQSQAPAIGGRGADVSRASPGTQLYGSFSHSQEHFMGPHNTGRQEAYRNITWQVPFTDQSPSPASDQHWPGQTMEQLARASNNSQPWLGQSATRIGSSIPAVAPQMVQQYALVIHDVPAQTMEDLVSYLSNSNVQYTLRLSLLGPGAPVGGQAAARRSVRIDDMALVAMHHLIHVLNTTELQGRARIIACFP